MREITDKPIPELNDLTEGFWKGGQEGRFVVQKCGSCKTHNFYPKPWCIECGSRDLEWVESTGVGAVYSFTISRSVAMNYPGWKSELPIVLALIDLEEGVRLYAQIVDCDPKEVFIGMSVVAFLADLNGDLKIPKFKPAK